MNISRQQKMDQALENKLSNDSKTGKNKKVEDKSSKAKKSEGSDANEAINKYVELEKELITNVDDYVLLNRLAPEIKDNEALKRNLKPKLLSMAKWFLGIQFFFLIVLICATFAGVFVAHYNDKPFSEETIKAAFTFIGAYITAVVVELIFILKHIVTNVFDSSIVDLMKVFKSETEELKKESNNKNNTVEEQNSTENLPESA